VNDETETKRSNPWYEVVGPEARLTQGDIILECPLLKWQLDDAARGEPKASGERLFKAAKGIKADVVVMTQACDLEQGKASDVVLCPCVPLSRYKPAWEDAERARKQNPTNKALSAFCEYVKNLYVWKLLMMDSLSDGEITPEHRVADFHSIHTVPRAFLDALIAERRAKRLRLQPPYREHLSQSFARFFMRVGLPTPITKAW
jgi:hypothetical protein